MIESTKSSFLRSTLTLLTGTSISQAIPFLALPILSRLYSPADFGFLSIYLTIASILAIVGTGRYELAVVLPEDEKVAKVVFSSSVFLLLAVCSITAFSISAWPQVALKALPGFTSWQSLLLIPAGAFSIGLFDLFSYWANRKKHYKRITIALIGFQLSAALLKGAFGALELLGFGLIVGTILARVLGTALLLNTELFKGLLNFSLRNTFSTLKLYYKFPSFNVPYSVLVTFSGGLLVLALSYFNFLEEAGFVGFSRTLLFGPVTILSVSLGRVFFEEAARKIHTPELESLFHFLMQSLLRVGLPALIFFAFWAEDLFALVFGESWRQAATYAACLSPVAFGYLFISWPERLYEVTGKQHFALILQIIFDLLATLLVTLVLVIYSDPLLATLTYTAVMTAYNLTYIYIVFRISRFNLAAANDLAKIFASVLSVSLLVFGSIALVFRHTLLSFFISILGLALLFYFLGAKKVMAHYRTIG